MRASKCKASESGPNPASSTSANSATLSLAKSFKTALTSKVHISDMEANYLVDQAVKEAEDKDSAKNPPEKILGPEYTGSRSMDKLDLVLIQFIYLLLLTLTILSVAMFLFPTSGNLGKTIRRATLWMAITSLHTT